MEPQILTVERDLDLGIKPSRVTSSLDLEQTRSNGENFYFVQENNEDVQIVYFAEKQTIMYRSIT